MLSTIRISETKTTQLKKSSRKLLLFRRVVLQPNCHTVILGSNALREEVELVRLVAAWYRLFGVSPIWVYIARQIE